MKKLFILFSLALIIGAVLLSFASKNNGYILIVYQKTSIEMSLWMAVLILTGLFSVLTLSLKLLYAINHWRFSRTAQKQINTTALAFNAFLNEDWKAVKKSLPALRKSETLEKKALEKIENKATQALS